MFEITLTPDNVTKVRTVRGTFTIRYSNEHRRYQVFQPRKRIPCRESYNGLQGALDIVSQLAN